MSQASKDSLNELHGLIAETLTGAIKAFKGKTDPEDLKGLAALANVATSPSSPSPLSFHFQVSLGARAKTMSHK
jgi:hypothetical protein